MFSARCLCSIFAYRQLFPPSLWNCSFCAWWADTTSEALPPSLLGSALASSRSVLELSGIGSLEHGGSFSQRLTEGTTVTPTCPPKNITTQTPYTVLDCHQLQVHGSSKTRSHKLTFSTLVIRLTVFSKNHFLIIAPFSCISYSPKLYLFQHTRIYHVKVPFQKFWFIPFQGQTLWHGADQTLPAILLHILLINPTNPTLQHEVRRKIKEGINKFNKIICVQSTIICSFLNIILFSGISFSLSCS